MTLPTHPETQLVLQAQSDSEAFGRLYDLYYHRVLNFFAHRTADSQLAADLTSDTFYAALKGLKKFKIHHQNSFSAWIFRVASNILNKHYKAFYRLPVIAWLNEKFDPPAPSIDIPSEELKYAEEQIEKSDLVNKIRQALKILSPPKYHLILCLFYFDKMSVTEIACTLNITESNAKTTLHRARAKLKTLCHEEL